MDLGVGGETKHICQYATYRRTITPAGWVQGCRCGRMVTVSIARRETAEKTDTVIKKNWYDADGNLERTTGSGA